MGIETILLVIGLIVGIAIYAGVKKVKGAGAAKTGRGGDKKQGSN